MPSITRRRAIAVAATAHDQQIRARVRLCMIAALGIALALTAVLASTLG